MGVLLLSGCSTLTTTTDVTYQTNHNAQNALYDLQHWSFEGRIAIVTKNDVEQVNISWTHFPSEELIKLSGPLGQGAVMIQLNAEGVTIDRGGGDIKTSANPEAFINQEIGLFVPVTSLRYWVVGVPEKSQDTKTIDSGFEQSGWRSQYKAMQSVKNYLLPRNMTVTNETVKLKLFIDQWSLDEN
jgi:outer membrane lipoprotein LolB